MGLLHLVQQHNRVGPAAGDSGAYPQENGTPYIFGKQWKESELNLYYAPLHGNPSLQQVRARLEEVSNISTAGHPDSVFGQWQCSADWPSYFPRVSIPDMAGFQGEIGWYDQVETLQGQHHTYYCHGILSFELVELVMRYARQRRADLQCPVGGGRSRRCVLSGVRGASGAGRFAGALARRQRG